MSSVVQWCRGNTTAQYCRDEMKNTTHLTGDWIYKILNIWNFYNIFRCVNPLYITFHSQNWRHSFRLRCTLHINDLHLIFYPLLQLYLCVGFKFRCALKQGRVIAAILVLPVQVVIKAGDVLQTNLRETLNLWTLRTETIALSSLIMETILMKV